MEKEKQQATKIDAAIKDTKLKLNDVKERIMLLSREREILIDQIDSLEAIKNNKLLK